MDALHLEDLDTGDLLLLFLKHLFHPFIIFVRRRPGKGQVKLPKTRAYSPDSESGSMF